jgi:KDO2-lipid IV(A) lauroyltransferase
MHFKQRLTDAGHYAVYLLVRIFVCVLQAVSIETCHRFARGLAWFVSDVLRVRHQIIEENLQHAFPEMSIADRRLLALQMWEHLLLMLAEIAHFPRKVHDTNWRDYIKFKNEAPMMREFFRNRPRVFVSGHYGNFELAGYTMGLFGFPTYTVARKLDNRYLDRFVNAWLRAEVTTPSVKAGFGAVMVWGYDNKWYQSAVTPSCLQPWCPVACT